MYHVAEIQDAHKFWSPLLGTKWAPILFAVALIAAGQSSTITEHWLANYHGGLLKFKNQPGA
jgi:Mn2+/Fe2+ NRAMP family transporter